MKKYLKRGLPFFVLLLTPSFVLSALYVYFDPFQVVKNNHSFTYSPVEPDRDFVSTENFLLKRSSHNFNSFIFGSSRATSFKVNSWVSHLDANAVPFAFDAAGESLFGIYSKLKFLDREKASIDNALIILCRDGYSKIDNHDDRLGIKHPEVSGESWIRFHLVNYKSYCTLDFLVGYYSFKLTGRENRFTNGIIQNRGIDIDTGSNQIYLRTWDEQLKGNPIEYYETRRNLFYERKEERVEMEGKIGDEHFAILSDMKNILERHHTNYKVILSPVYDQVRFPAEDKAALQLIFGDHLFDFTGRNFITKNDTNWYETYHFRPFIADTIMDIIYSDTADVRLWR